MALFSVTCHRFQGRQLKIPAMTNTEMEYWAGAASYEYIIWFQIAVDDVALFRQRQGKEHLMGVRPHCSQVQSHVLAESLDNIPQIHAAHVPREASSQFSQGFHRDVVKMSTDLKFSKTRHKWPRCSKVRSILTMCFLSSGSAAPNFCKIWASFLPATYLCQTLISL